MNFSNDYWSKGDIFLSVRSLSLIILYRPSTNEVIWYKQGPWRFQHIDIVDDNTIAIFDNNVTLGWGEGLSIIIIYIFIILKPGPAKKI